MSKVYGYVSPNSTNSIINFIAASETGLVPIIGKMLYFDTTVGGKIYRAIGTVTQIRTENSLFGAKFNNVVANGQYMHEVSPDLRSSSFITQAVFVKDEKDSAWMQSGASLPTSPSTNTSVHLVDEEVLQEMTQGLLLPAVGTFRGGDIPLPINTPDFGGNRGAYHSGVLGKSGSGKTAGYTFILSSYMRHEQHAVLVIDPQGQWSNENGFIFSPQRFAEGLGREVKVIRIAEEVQLPRDPDLLARIIDQMDAWSRLRRMGPENKLLFSREVAELLMNGKTKFNDEARGLLSKVFVTIAKSNSALSRIYADEKRRGAFKEELYALAGEEPDNVDIYADGYEPPSTEDLEDVEKNWASILKVFTPLLNLFASKNLHDSTRHTLSGAKGILTDIFQVRKEGSKPAPYVIIDMSPDVKIHAKKALNANDMDSAMAALLDKESVKALILQILFSEIKKASEIAFAVGGGNLNTQIVFDEAWRYAPEGKAIPEIEELANMLEGFAFDTRKFGIGWTYILQSPSDLKRGIWSQLSYIYAAYGLVGNDVKVLEERYSDTSQTAIYNGFISPASTNIYPMMIIGSISPLIFTNAPTFVDLFTSAEDFLDANRKWVNEIIVRRGLPSVTANSVDPKVMGLRKAKSDAPAGLVTRSYKVAKNYSVSEPQTQVSSKPTDAVETADGDFPW